MLEAMLRKKRLQFCIGCNVASKDFPLKTLRQRLDDLGSFGNFLEINPRSTEVMPIGFTTIVMKLRQACDDIN